MRTDFCFVARRTTRGQTVSRDTRQNPGRDAGDFVMGSEARRRTTRSMTRLEIKVERAERARSELELERRDGRNGARPARVHQRTRAHRSSAAGNRQREQAWYTRSLRPARGTRLPAGEQAARSRGARRLEPRPSGGNWASEEPRQGRERSRAERCWEVEGEKQGAARLGKQAETLSRGGRRQGVERRHRGEQSRDGSTTGSQPPWEMELGHGLE
jgi:hypothetical protein